MLNESLKKNDWYIIYYSLKMWHLFSEAKKMDSLSSNSKPLLTDMDSKSLLTVLLTPVLTINDLCKENEGKSLYINSKTGSWVFSTSTLVLRKDSNHPSVPSIYSFLTIRMKDHYIFYLTTGNKVTMYHEDNNIIFTMDDKENIKYTNYKWID